MKDRRNPIAESLVDLKTGDMCETIALVTVRKQESLESEVLAELQVGTTLYVSELGTGRRIQIDFGINGSYRESGWISCKTKLNEPLVIKCSESVYLSTMDFDVGGRHEVKALITVRECEDLDSDYVTELIAGSTVTILQLGSHNKRRVKVSSPNATGWISTSTKNGEALIGKLGDAKTPAVHYTSVGSKVKSLLENARAGDVDSLRKVAEVGSGVVGRLTSKPNLNSSDVRGKTALIYAAAYGHKVVVRYLLTKKEVDVNATDDTQKSALHHASKWAKRVDCPDVEPAQGDIVRMLLNAGAYMEARDHNGCTALMFSVANGEAYVTQELLRAMANVNVKDFEGHRPLDYAVNFEHTHIERMLREHGGTGHDYSPAKQEFVGSTKVHETTGDGAGGVWNQNMDAVWLMNKTAIESAGVLGNGNSPRETPADETATSTTAGASSSAAISDVTDASSPKGTAKKKKTVKKKSVAAPGAETRLSTKESPTGSPSEGAKEKPKTKAKKKSKKGEDSKKGAKLKTGVMMEALADEATLSGEVCVEDMPKEDVDLKVRELAKLQMVVQTCTAPGELEAAIKVAVAEGANDSELVEARKKLNELKIRFAARDHLLQASRERNVEELEIAILKAEELGLKDSELKNAKKVLLQEKPKQIARNMLNEAKEKGDTQQLKKAVKKALEAGILESDLEEYRALLAGAESRDKAEAALNRAMGEKDVPRLKFSIEQAKEAGASPEAIRQAEEILAVEEPKHLARLQLDAAIDECKKDMLEKAIAQGRKVGLEDVELAEAIQVLRREEKKERLLEAANKMVQDSMTVDQTSIDALRDVKEKISSAIVEATQMGVAETALYAVEMRRKKIHNMIEDLKGSIRVFCRTRPFNDNEAALGDTQVTKQLDLMTLAVGEKFEQQFKFDAVFSPGTQSEIFEDCKDLVQSAVDGYNVTLFAYGQTGAGKTFTMAGKPGALGVCPRTIQEVFKVTEANQDRFEYTVMASMLELYRTDLVDLLVKGNPIASKNKLKIREDKTQNITVEHLTEEQCFSAEELEAFVERGSAARAVAATNMNSESSRSHLLTIIKIISRNKETEEQLRGKIFIVDLAGSERLSKSQTTGESQKESIEINKSLTALGDVIEALTKGLKVIPYRNHKLTMLMQDALGGTAKTLMFVNCSPSSSNLEETVNSLKYATRAKLVTNNTAVKK